MIIIILSYSSLPYTDKKKLKKHIPTKTWKTNKKQFSSDFQTYPHKFPKFSTYSGHSASESTFSGSEIKSTDGASSDALRLRVGHVERLGTLGLHFLAAAKTKHFHFNIGRFLPDFETFKRGLPQETKTTKNHTEKWDLSYDEVFLLLEVRKSCSSGQLLSWKTSIVIQAVGFIMRLNETIYCIYKLMSGFLQSLFQRW